MNLRRWWPDIRRTSAIVFFLLFLAIPVALLASVQPWIFAAILSGLGTVAFIVSVYISPQTRRGTRNAAKGLLTAAAILAIIHFSNVLEPFYRREGWLLLELDVQVAPLEVRAGDSLTYTLSTTNTGVRPARGRQFIVDGLPYTGVLVYGVLPDLHSAYFTITGTPTASVSSKTEVLDAQQKVCTVVYANPRELDVNPMYWLWSTTYTPGWKAVAAITSDGRKNQDLAIGTTFELQYQVTVPLNHPEDRVHQRRASLSYRDPQWATYYVHDLWFPFDEVITVVPAPD